MKRAVKWSKEEPEMEDIIERLEAEQRRSGMWADTCELLQEAAEEIRLLREGPSQAELWRILEQASFADDNARRETIRRLVAWFGGSRGAMAKLNAAREAAKQEVA